MIRGTPIAAPNKRPGSPSDACVAVGGVEKAASPPPKRQRTIDVGARVVQANADIRHGVAWLSIHINAFPHGLLCSIFIKLKKNPIPAVLFCGSRVNRGSLIPGSLSTYATGSAFSFLDAAFAFVTSASHKSTHAHERQTDETRFFFFPLSGPCPGRPRPVVAPLAPRLHSSFPPPTCGASLPQPALRVLIFSCAELPARPGSSNNKANTAVIHSCRTTSINLLQSTHRRSFYTIYTR